MEFVARIASRTGVVTEEPFTAESEDALRLDLEKRGFHVFKVRAKMSALGFGFAGLGSTVDETDFLTFNQELISLIHAGLPLLQCLTLLSERRKNVRFRQILKDVESKVKAGSSLSDAFASHGAAFPAVSAPSLMAGEKSGSLEDVLRRYVTYAKVLHAVRRKVTAALVYPAVLIMLSLGLMVILVTFVIPKFTAFYKDFDAQLPLPTVVLVSISGFAESHVWLLASLVVGGVIGLRAASLHPSARVLRDRVFLGLPLAGEVIRKYSMSQFSRTLATLLGGGLPLVPSLDIAARSVTNAAIAATIGTVPPKIREGGSLTDALEKTGLWSDTTLQMIKVGESAGALTEMLTNVSDFYDAEVDRQVQTFVTLLEPALLVLMGFVVSGMLLAMYYPLFNLIQAVQ
ncbi:MAG: type II secretion system F family protein [Acidobacteriota bacterium]